MLGLAKMAEQHTGSKWHRQGEAARPLVDFLVIGAMRAGTTALHHWLTSQPDLTMAKSKESDFFIAEKNYGRGPQWYQKQFCPHTMLRGDISPNYTKRDVFKNVPARAAKANAQMKIIFIARDPVARAISHYHHSLAMGQNMPEPEALLGSEVGAHILATSRYFYQLQIWWDYFSADQFLILDYNQWLQAPHQAKTKLADFLGFNLTDHEQSTSRLNDSENLQKLPRWWTRASQTPMGKMLRSGLSAENKQKLKKHFSRKNHQPKIEFSPALRAEIYAHLEEDIELFHKATGLNFDQGEH